ncbi:MAG: JAB-like toxin 1 domain-containing protein [Bacteroidaceae bacterium]
MKLSKRIFKTKTNQRCNLHQLGANMSALDKSFLQMLVGGGTKYFFDEHGNITGTETIAGADDVINVNGNNMSLSGSMGLKEPAEGGQQSGVTFTGSALSPEVFKFLADNTDVEWGYCFKKGESGGFLTTSNSKHSVDIPDEANASKTGYDSFMHNHSQTSAETGLTENQVNEYNSHPSQADKDRMEMLGYASGIIYNEGNDTLTEYNSNTKTQETLAKENQWEITENN